MGMGFSNWVEAQLVAGVWTDLTSDTHAEAGLRLRYGINGNKPQDCLAGIGDSQWSMQNWATAAGRAQGYYSPLHASVRSGWTYDIPVQHVFAHGSDAVLSVSSITRASSTATVTTATNHGLATGEKAKISGAAEVEYNGTFQVTVTGVTTFTYTVSGTPATPATGTITARKAYIKHRGTIDDIDPDAGRYGSQQVRVTSYDGMLPLYDADIRSIVTQQNKTEFELIAAVLDALPADAQPLARDLDTGADTVVIAFHDLEGGLKAAGVIQDVLQSAFAIAFTKGDGTFCGLSRHSRATAASSYTFSDTMHGLKVPSKKDNVYGVVRVTIRPPDVSSAATEELYTLPSGVTIEIAPGATVEVWTDYSDPNDRQVPVGGISVVEVLVGGTHYAANSAADGSGSDLTGSITADIDPFSSTAKWTLTNGHATLTAYIRTLKPIGKAIRSRAPQTYQHPTTDAGRPLNIDLRYQSSGTVAKSYAEYLYGQFSSLANQIVSMEFKANDSSDFMRQALEREPGDVITVAETMTGVSTQAVIHSIEFEVTAGPWLVCRWGLAAASPFTPWIADVSEAGVDTAPGF